MVQLILSLLITLKVLPMWVTPLIPIIVKDLPLVEEIVSSLITALNIIKANPQADQKTVSTIETIITHFQTIDPSEIPSYNSKGEVVPLGKK